MKIVVKKLSILISGLFLILCIQQSFGEEISSNVALFKNPPSWLKSREVDHVADQIQEKLEWDIRRVNVIWYLNQKAFEDFHHFGPSVLAVTDKEKNTIHLGPRVVSSNFSAVFGHELVHIILFQKYKKSVPPWLEEGLANYISKKGTVNYKLLAANPIADVHTMVHPFLDAKKSSLSPELHYQISTAIIEMIANQCNLEDLLQLSVGSNLETFIVRTCEMSDINQEFKKWVSKKSR